MPRQRPIHELWRQAVFKGIFLPLVASYSDRLFMQEDHVNIHDHPCHSEEAKWLSWICIRQLCCCNDCGCSCGSYHKCPCQVCASFLKKLFFKANPGRVGNQARYLQWNKSRVLLHYGFRSFSIAPKPCPAVGNDRSQFFHHRSSQCGSWCL